MKKLILTMIVSLSSFNALAVDCDKHKIYCKIIELRPKVDHAFAMELSNHIHRYSQVFETDPMISVAIAMQETRFRDINRYESIYKKGHVVRGPADLGVFQIRVQTAEDYGLDIDRIQTDLEYNTAAHMKILRSKMRTCKRKELAKGVEWSCYHSFTKKHRNKYVKDVSRWF